jgi:glycerol-3-phosphate dehydrogenase
VLYGQPLSVYGSDAKRIQELIKENPDWSSRLHPSHVYLKAEVIWAVRMEMAQQVEDVLSRRLRLLFIDAQAAIDIAPEVARLMAFEMKYSREWEEEQISSFVEVAKGYLA